MPLLALGKPLFTLIEALDSVVCAHDMKMIALSPDQPGRPLLANKTPCALEMMTQLCGQWEYSYQCGLGD